jgi:DeoR/GlpR family transcriptional regulator of sugar metabolism
MIKSNGSLTIAELAGHVGISTRAVEKQISKLKAENRIRRVGSLRGGLLGNSSAILNLEGVTCRRMRV